MAGQATGDGTSTQSQRHWVEELFPPHFTLNVSDLTKKPEQAAEGTQEAWRLAQRMKVRDIYHEVKARMDAEALIPKDKNIQVGDPMVESEENVRLKGHVRRLGSSMRKEGLTSLEGGEKQKRKNSDDSLWSAGEIAILRSEFRKVKEEQQITLIELKALREEHEELRERYKRQEEALNATANKLKQSRKENKRLILQNEHLAKDVRLQKSKLSMAEGDYRDVVEQRLGLKREMRELRKSHVQATQELKELRIRLSESHAKHRLESMEKEEATKLEYDSQIARLYQELGETRLELDKEQKEHRRSKKALDQLRIHFAQQAGKTNAGSHLDQNEGRTLRVLQLY